MNLSDVSAQAIFAYKVKNHKHDLTIHDSCHRILLFIFANYLLPEIHQALFEDSFELGSMVVHNFLYTFDCPSCCNEDFRSISHYSGTYWPVNNIKQQKLKTCISESLQEYNIIPCEYITILLPYCDINNRIY